MKMKLVGIVAGAIALSVAGVASAADMPVKARPVPVPVPVFSWTGFYVGIHGGGMWAEKDWTERCSALVGAACTVPDAGGPFQTSHKITSGLVGGQIGYNWQMNNFLIGVEGDASWAWENESCSQVVGNQAGFFAFNRAAGCSRTDWLATVTGRAGFVAGQALFYGKGGVAFAHDSYVARCTALNGGLCVPIGAAMTTSPSEDRVGWTVGVGIEYAFSPNWSIKGEYNYMDFGTETNRFTTTLFPANSIHDVDIRQHVSVAKIGINYRFGGAAVVAKY